MKKYALDLSFSILIFLFVLFSITNLGFFLKIPVNEGYTLLAFLSAIFFIFKQKNCFVKIFSFLIILFVSLLCSKFFIDSSFDGRCYHFTIEYLFKLGYNPIFQNMEEFANKNNIFYNILFANSYPNAIEAIRNNIYLFFEDMESSKSINYLFVFSGFLYLFYFFLNKLNIIKSLILAFATILCSCVICEINTKMNDFAVFIIFIFQLFSIILISQKTDKKINTIILILSSILAFGIKYISLYNTFIIFIVYFIYKLIKKENLIPLLKITAIILFSSMILCFQPYITNIIKFQNPFYPSIGFNKKDFMTMQNPKEFDKKPYIYKFIRSMFSCSSDSRMNNKESLPLFYKLPFEKKYDLPFYGAEFRINGFGHIYSGIFILSLIASIYLIIKKRMTFAFLVIYITTFLNPLCWWARFVSQLYLVPCICSFEFLKTKNIFKNLTAYLFIFLLFFNAFWIMKENFIGNAFSTGILNEFYSDLHQKSQKNKIKIFIKKENLDENDVSILARLRYYNIDYEITDNYDNSFIAPKLSTSITNTYLFKY